MSPTATTFSPPPRRPWLLAACVVALGLALVAGVSVGSVRLPPLAVVQLLVDKVFPLNLNYPDTYRVILFDIRLPRVVLMALTGMALSTAGAAYQGLFRNPLADPYLVGVASGAGLGATAVITFIPVGTVAALGLFAVPVGAFLGGLLTVTLVMLIAQVGRAMPVTTMLLAGVAVGSFCTAVTTLWMMRSPEGLQRAFNWLLGGYSGGGWLPVWILLPYLVAGGVGLLVCAHPLNLLQLGEEQARQLGVNVGRVKLALIASATLMTAAAVAFGGLIGFVGLIVPHILRVLGGPDYRRLLPLAALGGAAFLIFADLLARTLLAPQELPVGVITALTGAPFFVILLRQLKRSVF